MIYFGPLIGANPNGENPKAPNGENPNGENPNAPKGANEKVVVTLLDAPEVPEFPFALVAKIVYVWAVPCS